MEDFSANYWQGMHVPPVLGALSVLANLALALIGMYFVTPDYFGFVLASVCLDQHYHYLCNLGGFMLGRYSVHSFQGQSSSHVFEGIFSFGRSFLCFIYLTKAHYGL